MRIGSQFPFDQVPSVFCHRGPWSWWALRWRQKDTRVVLTVVLYYLFLLLTAVTVCAGCMSVSEKFMKQLSFGQICNFLF